MASPQCEDGWFKLSHELDAALACADFTKGARIVLREVFAQIYGKAKRRSAHLSPPEIAGRYGLKREAVWRGVRELVESRALERLDDGSYRFVKDYERWLAWDRRNGSESATPRLTAKEVACCLYAPAVSLAYASGEPFGGGESPPLKAPKERNPMVTEGSPDRNPIDTPTVTQLTRDRINRVTQTVTQLPRFETSPQTPLVGKERLETGDDETVAAEAAEAVPRLDSPSAPEAKPAPEPITPEPAPDPTRDLARWAESLPGHEMESLGGWVATMAAQYPLDWIKLALLDGVSNNPKQFKSYVHGCLKRWHAVGGPLDLKAVELAARAEREPKAPPMLKYVEPETDPRYRRRPMRAEGGA